MNKIETNENGNVLFTSGMGGTARYERVAEDNYVMSAKKDAPRMVQVKSSRFDPYPLIVQEATENHMLCLDKLLVPLGRVEEGTKEEGDGMFLFILVKHDLKDFRHSLDDSYMLWRSGDSNLKIYDVVKNKTDETIKEFWKYQNETTKPIAAIASADAYRVLGVSISETKATILHYYERQDQNITIMSEVDRKVLEPLLVSLNSAEVSSNGNFAYLGGLSMKDQTTKVPTLYVCEFNRGFKIRAKEILDEPNSKQPIVMRRFPSYEILAIGLYQTLILVEFDENTNKVQKLARIPNYHSDYIAGMAIKGEKIFTKSLGEKFVKVMYFGSKMDQSVLMNPALTSALNSALNPSPIAETSRLPENLPPETIRYRQSQQSRIPINTECVFEKIALSKTARAIYVGGSSGVDMLKFNDQSQQFVHTPIPVN